MGGGFDSVRDRDRAAAGGEGDIGADLIAIRDEPREWDMAQGLWRRWAVRRGGPATRRCAGVGMGSYRTSRSSSRRRFVSCTEDR